MKIQMIHRSSLVIACLCSIGLMTSCEKFLELHPRDQKVVSTIEDYRAIMASYLSLLKTPNRNQDPVFGINFNYPYFDMAKYLGIYTGETVLNRNSFFYYDKNTSTYTAEGLQLLTWMNTEPYCWNQYYRFIGSLNLLISGVRTAKGNEEDWRNRILGEGLVWRAFSFYKLLQYYSPYKNNRYGIPVYLDPVKDIANAMPSRQTQQEVFTQILNDCREALSLLEKTPGSDWNCAWREDFIYAMMASIYTWKAMSGAAGETDWNQAEQCATAAMKGRSLTHSPETLRQMFDCRKVTTASTMISDEFYFRLLDGNNGQLFNFPYAYYQAELVDGTATHEYYSLFRDNDIRKGIYFTANGLQSDKYNLLGLGNGIIASARGGSLMLFRLAEMYLIKAEALLRQGKTGEARKVLEEFKSARYEGPFDLPGDTEGILQEILNERSREFYMENDFRWLDMKRLGITLKRTIGRHTYTLTPDDFRYSFPIPAKEIELNRNLDQNPGWENVQLE